MDRLLAFTGRIVLCGALAPFLSTIQAAEPAGREARIEELIRQMTLEEKVAMCHGDTFWTAAGVPRLGIPPIRMSDGPHGVREEKEPHGFGSIHRSDDCSTSLPASSALACTWNPAMGAKHGYVLGREARDHGKDIILGPSIEMVRTPLGGRNFEVYSEDPLLAAQIVVPNIRAIQSSGIAACAKTFLLNNQDLNRFGYNVEVADRALYEIFLPPYEAAVHEAGVLAIMGSYNKLHGRQMCHNRRMVQEILKGQFGFRGVFMSDWGGAKDSDEAARFGLDLEMGTGKDYTRYHMSQPLLDGLRSGKYPVALVDEKVRRHLRLRFAIGLMPGQTRPVGARNTPEHRQIARQIAQEAIVLLKNNGVLPLDKNSRKTVAVLGANADRKQAGGGGSSEVKPPYEITPLEGIKNALAGRAVVRPDGPAAAAALQLARSADAVVYVTGLNKTLDTEGNDRPNLAIPAADRMLLEQVLDANPNTVVVVLAGSPVEMPWKDKARAIVYASYLGQEAGNALADVLFGEVNPSGRLAVTFPQKLSDSPAHALADGYRPTTSVYGEGIFVGYRWFESKNIEPLWPFGHGLSYTTFAYSDLKVRELADQTDNLAEVSVAVTNSGPRAGREVVELYVEAPQGSVPRPVKELKGFAKLSLAPGERQVATFTLTRRALSFYDEASGAWKLEPGRFHVLAGSTSRDIRLRASFDLRDPAR